MTESLENSAQLDVIASSNVCLPKITNAQQGNKLSSTPNSIKNGQETWDVRVEIHLHPSEKQEDHPVDSHERSACRATFCKQHPYRIYSKIRETV
jgi:hypothetical protein